MTTSVLRILFLLAGLVLMVGVACCYIGREKSVTDTADRNNVPSRCVIEVRRGGGSQPGPHPIWISIYNDGLICNQYGEHHVDAESVEQLLQHIVTTGLFDIDQNQFDAKLHEAGELNLSVRGGSGVYTISTELDGVMHSLRLNRPELYTNSVVLHARRFLEVLTTIKKKAAQQ